MEVKVELNGMLYNARIKMQGDMMVVSPVSGKIGCYNIKNGELIVLVSANGKRTLVLANMVSDSEDGPVLHYHASMTTNDDDFEEHGQIGLFPFIIEKPEVNEKWQMLGKLSENNLIWDEENGCLTEFNEGDIVFCSYGKERPFKWIFACKSFERMANNYYIEDFCGFDDNNNIWLESGYSDAATFIRLATQKEKEQFSKKMAENGKKWNEQTRKLE